MINKINNTGIIISYVKIKTENDYGYIITDIQGIKSPAEIISKYGSKVYSDYLKSDNRIFVFNPFSDKKKIVIESKEGLDKKSKYVKVTRTLTTNKSIMDKRLFLTIIRRISIAKDNLKKIASSSYMEINKPINNKLSVYKEVFTFL